MCRDYSLSVCREYFLSVCREYSLGMCREHSLSVCRKLVMLQYQFIHSTLTWTTSDVTVSVYT